MGRNKLGGRTATFAGFSALAWLLCGPWLSAGQAPEKLAAKLLATAGVRGGLVIHVGCGDGRLTAALRASDSFVVHGLARDQAEVEKARANIARSGLYGAVAVERWTTAPALPYAGNLARLVVVSEGASVSREELLRVLAPLGVALIQKGNSWEKLAKPWPKDIDEWTHYLHGADNNGVALDTEVGPPRRLRWVARPLWCRSHEFNTSVAAVVTARGRLFAILDEGIRGIWDPRLPSRWALVARDAFSGVLLWKRPIPKWGWREWNTRGLWSSPISLPRRLVADGDRVFVTMGYHAPVSMLDAATGKTLRVFAQTDGADEILFCDGVLLACCRKQLVVAYEPKGAGRTRRRPNPHEWPLGSPGPGSIVALDPTSGKTLWRTAPGPIGILTLAARNGRVAYHTGRQLVCLDLKSGKRLWAADCPAQRTSRHSAGTLVLLDDLVLYTSGQGLAAHSAANGKRLWTGPRVYGPGIAHPPDLFVAQGLVWSGKTGRYDRSATAVRREGRDPHTGEVRRVVEVPKLISPLHHWRCYRSKATERFLLLGKRGVEFLDLVGKDHMRNDWLRPPCSYGALPANGLLYVPPSQCFCYPGVNLVGFLALSSGAAPPRVAGQTSGAKGPRLERGPAYGGGVAAGSLSPADWPTYRHDPKRSGFSPVKLAERLTVKWEASLGARAWQPVVAGGRVFAATSATHTLHALDAATGKRLWRFVAGGRIDSPPTVFGGSVLFGCADGWVYCVAAADGRLAWRFRAAPEERRIVAFGGVESPWPVHGSVLVQNGVAYCTAGRSSYLDGGIWLYGLDPATGRVLHQSRLEGPWPNVFKDTGRPFDMDGSRSDILVSDGTDLYMLAERFGPALARKTGPRVTSLGARETGLHLVATGTFLDHTWFDRTYWAYWRRWPGFYFANNASKCGQILCFDDRAVYGLHVFTRRLRLSPWFVPGQGYTLFADAVGNEPVLKPEHVNREKGYGYSRVKAPLWAKQIPVRALAMVLTPGRLFLAGPPDVIPDDRPYAAFDGELGSALWAVSTADGKKLWEMKLKTVPVFDGLVAARGRLYLASGDGRITCFGAQ